MAKNRTKKKNPGVGIDFARVKRKVGKRIAKNVGETRIDKKHLRAATLRLAHQNAFDYAGEERDECGYGQEKHGRDGEEGRTSGGSNAERNRGGNRGAALKPWPILVNEATTHPSAAHRRRCVEALRGVAEKTTWDGQSIDEAVHANTARHESESESSFIDKAIRVSCLRLADESNAVRLEALALIKALLYRYTGLQGEDKSTTSVRNANNGTCMKSIIQSHEVCSSVMLPFLDNFAAQLAGCIANPIISIQKISLEATSEVLASVGKAMSAKYVTQIVMQVGALIGYMSESNMNRGIVGDMETKRVQLKCLRSSVEALLSIAAADRDYDRRDESLLDRACTGQLFARHRRASRASSSMTSRSPVAIHYDHDGADQISKFSIFISHIVSCFKMCGPAELETSSDDIMAMKVSGSLDCMVECMHSLVVLLKHVKQVVKSIETFSISDRPNEECESSWQSACVRSLLNVISDVLSFVPVNEPLSLNFRDTEVASICQDLQQLNLMTLELVPHISDCLRVVTKSDKLCADMLPDQCEQTITSLLCETIMTGKVLLANNVQSRDYKTKVHEFSSNKMVIIVDAVHFLINTCSFDIQERVLEVMCSRIASSISMSNSSNCEYLKIFNSLLSNIIERTDQSANYHDAVIVLLARRLLPLLPQALWELKTRDVESSYEWLSLLLGVSKLCSDCPDISAAVEAIMDQLCPLIALQRQQTSTGSSVKKQINKVVLGPLMKFSSLNIRDNFAAVLFYLPPPLSRTLLRSLAMAVLSRTDTEFSLKIIRNIGLRGKRMATKDWASSAQSKHQPAGSHSSQSPTDSDCKKLEIQNCTSFLISIICGKMEGFNFNGATGRKDGHGTNGSGAAESRHSICAEACRALCEWFAPDVVTSFVLPKVKTVADAILDASDNVQPEENSILESIELLQHICT